MRELGTAELLVLGSTPSLGLCKDVFVSSIQICGLNLVLDLGLDFVKGLVTFVNVLRRMLRVSKVSM